MTMIAKPFNKPIPTHGSCPNTKAGWDAEQDAAFRLDRAFGDPLERDVRLFHDLRLPATFASGEVAAGDFFQIDHLVLHRHGAALVESKSVTGDLYVDRLGQWQRQRAGHKENVPSPVTQVQQQATALKRLCQSASPPLLNKILGIAQAGFGNFPAAPFVAISSKGRFTGETGPFEAIVMKVDRIVETIQAEISRHSSQTGIMGTLRGAIVGDTSDAGTFNLTLDELDRIEQFLRARHTPTARGIGAGTEAKRAVVTPVAVPVKAAANRGRVERLEALTCGKCRSVHVKVVYARDYCLKCDECGKYTSLAYTCPLCGKHATIRKSGPEHFRECDGEGGCGTQAVFWRAGEVR